MSVPTARESKVGRVVPNAPLPVIPLGELAANEPNSITDGPFGSKLKTAHYTDAGPRVIRLTNIGDGVFIDAKAHISEAHFSSLQKHRAFPGDVVIAALGENPPRSCLVPDFLGPAIVKADCIRFKTGPRILPAFLNYVLNAPDLRRHAKGIIHGVGRPRLNLGEIKALPIPVPPIADQRRMVAEIEKQFTRLEAGVAALRRVQASLKRYRAAVLKAACEGRLVPTEAELAHARASKRGSIPRATATPDFESGAKLLERILAERRKNWTGRGKYKEPAAPDATNLRLVPEGWVWTTLDSLLREPLRNGHSAKSTNATNGLRVFTLSAVTEGDFTQRNTKLSVATAEKVVGLWAEPGDIYVERSNTPELVGIARLYKGPSRFAFIPDLFIRVRIAPLVSERFVELCLLSKRGRAFFRARAQGISGTMPKIDQETVELAPIPLPPLAEQTRIVAEVERRLSVVEELETLVHANLQRATRLRQSVLQRAFSGGVSA